MCSSRDLFVLENSLKQLIRVVYLISRPHQVNLIGLTCLIGTLMNFPKNLINSDFWNCVKNLPVEKIRMFGRAPLMTLVPNFNKCCALSHFYSKNVFSERKLFLNTFELYLLERYVFRQKSCNFEHGLETKNEFEKWPLITFFQCVLTYRN